MSATPVICFGQQPCGFFPKRFLFAKIATARRLRAEIGGTIVFFYHDSDHDPRETRTVLRDPRTGGPVALNFGWAGKVQRKWSPLYLKRVLPEWHAMMSRQLGGLVGRDLVECFRRVQAPNVSGFCLEMYRAMGLLDGVTVMRSSDASFRRAAARVPEFYVDVPYAGEIVRAQWFDGAPRLHDGGDSYVRLPPSPFAPEQVSPARDTRLVWMQSVIRCTHYVAGAGEQAYLNQEDAPEINYVQREPIDRADEAYIG